MPVLLQLNTTLNQGSTGRIAEEIGNAATNQGWKCLIAHGARYHNPSKLSSIQVDSMWNERLHYGWYSLLLDRHGLGCTQATRQLIHKIEKEIHPDIIHLHNLHGYYLNYKLLFEYLAKTNIPVIWTLHDCWAFTGHCTYFDLIGCNRWKTECKNCPQHNTYPQSLFIDNSKRNFHLKKNLFTTINDRLVLIPVSNWLKDLVSQSFLKDSRQLVIHNGIDINAFTPCDFSKLIAQYNLSSQRIILGVSSWWNTRKGFQDFIRLRSMLPLDEYTIVLVGVSKKQLQNLPDGIIGIERTQNIQELAQWYSAADVFFNPTHQDNYPTVNLEAISCGTPVITYRTGGSIESITPNTGVIVEQNDLQSVLDALNLLHSRDRNIIRNTCRIYAEQHFDKQICFQRYIDLYNELLHKK